MNREIKFRGKSLNGGWLYGNLQVPKPPFDDFFMWDENLDQRKVVPDTIGQYTGLKDKNGNEIYEGDMLMFENFTAVVRWNEELATFALQFSFEGKVGNNPLGEWKNIEVIGNIHDNPELIKQ